MDKIPTFVDVEEYSKFSPQEKADRLNKLTNYLKQLKMSKLEKHLPDLISTFDVDIKIPILRIEDGAYSNMSKLKQLTCTIIEKLSLWVDGAGYSNITCLNTPYSASLLDLILEVINPKYEEDIKVLTEIKQVLDKIMPMLEPF